jgi:DNA-binding CsgD family transcriptional regulator
MSQTDGLLREISEKLDKIMRLLAVDAVKEYATQQEKIDLLDSLGFRPTEIAKLLNKSPDNIYVQLNIIRKKRDNVAKTSAKESNEKTSA